VKADYLPKPNSRAKATLASFAAQADYVQTNLVSDMPGLGQITDASLKNPWGMSFSPSSPFWISDQGANVSTLYSVSGGTVTKAPPPPKVPSRFLFLLQRADHKVPPARSTTHLIRGQMRRSRWVVRRQLSSLRI
jgi:hypothetical protein